MWPVSRSAPAGGVPNIARRHAVPWGAAIGLHVLLFLFAGYLIAPPFDFLKDEKLVVKPVTFERLPPPPPKLEGDLAAVTITMSPRFRPRIVKPQGVPLKMTNEFGSPAVALFRYWCANRPDTMEATGRTCPNDVPFTGLAALPQQALSNHADAGALFGPGDQGYTIDEAAARRGWVKPKPSAEAAQRAKTDKTVGAHSDDVYGGMPWDATPYGH